MDRLPFSAILLLLLGVTALAGFVTGNLQRVWIPTLFGQPADTGPLATGAVIAGGAVAGNRRAGVA